MNQILFISFASATVVSLIGGIDKFHFVNLGNIRIINEKGIFIPENDFLVLLGYFKDVEEAAQALYNYNSGEVTKTLHPP